MIIETLETVWSGTLEREGKAPGLSTYSGPSSMFDPRWSKIERLEAGEVNELRLRPARVDAQTKDRILQRLKFGMTYSQIHAEIGASVAVIRRVAQNNGIVPAWWKAHRSAAA